MLTVFLMKSPCFFGIGVKWKVPILDFSACLHNPHRCNMRLGHSHAFEPTGVCLGWFASSLHESRRVDFKNYLCVFMLHDPRAVLLHLMFPSIVSALHTSHAPKF